jgi:hypothetical protein
MNRTLFLLIALLAWAGCSEDPGTVGIGVLPPQDTLKVFSYETYASSDTTIMRRVVGGSTSMLLGTYESIEARTIFSFAGMSVIPQSAVLDSARLTLHINYRFRDSSGIVGFEAHRFARGFSGTGFSWDTAAAAGAYSDTISAALLESISPADTVISVLLDTALIRMWISADAGSLLLIPTGNFVVGISPLSATTYGDARPKLEIYYNGNDTLPVTFRTSAGLFVANGSATELPGTMTLQSAVAFRGIVRFDSIAIPKRVSVTKALLQFAADTAAAELNGYSNDNVTAYLLRKNVPPFDSLAIATACGAAYDGSQKIYVADVKAIVQQWLLKEPNYGFLLRTAGELATLDRIVLYGAAASPALRPKLTITYTVLP